MISIRRLSGKTYITLIDVFIIIFSYVFSFFIRGILDKDLGLSFTKSIYSLPFVIIIFIVSMYINNIKISEFNTSKRKYILSTLYHFYFGFFLTVFFLFYLKLFTYSRLALLLFFVNTTILLVIFKIISFKLFNKLKVLIIGENKSAQNFIKLFNSFSIIEVEPVMILEYEKRRILKIFGDIVKTRNIDWVVILKEGMDELINLCNEVGIPVSYSLDLVLKTDYYYVNIEDVGNFKFISFHRNYFEEAEIALKYIIDRLLALIFIIIFSPLFIVIPILIKLTSKGPVIFKQVRVGLNGKKFVMYKFRTMYEHAEKLKKELENYNEMEIAFKIKNDPRITRIGKILRRFSLDELPQFFNILKGDMSIVGPRPPLPEEIKKYELWHRRRLSMKPGLTCFWQISGRNEINFKDWMELDLKYIDNWSIWLDIYILLKTIPEVIRGRGAY